LVLPCRRLFFGGFYYGVGFFLIFCSSGRVCFWLFAYGVGLSLLFIGLLGSPLCGAALTFFAAA